MVRWLVLAVLLAAVVSCKGACSRTGSSSTCDAYERDVEATAAAAAGACARDSDCKCFQGGVSPKLPCGGVTDSASAAKIEATRAAYDAAGCSNRIVCAAWMCAPACIAGRCENGAR